MKVKSVKKVSGLTDDEFVKKYESGYQPVDVVVKKLFEKEPL